MQPTMDNIIFRDRHFCITHRGLQTCHVYGVKAHVRPLDGSTQVIRMNCEDVDFVEPYLDTDFPYGIGLVHVQEGYVAAPDYHLISVDPHEILEFFKRNSLTQGFTIQYGISTKRGVVVSIFKKGKMTLKVIKSLLEMGLDQWMFSSCWSPKWFLINREIVPVAANLDLTTGADVNPWLKALYGREVPNTAGFSLKILSPEHLERMK